MEKLDTSQYTPFVSDVIKELEDGIENNEIEFTNRNALTFYALNLFDHPIVQQYIDKSRENEDFWQDDVKDELHTYIFNEQYILQGLAKLDILEEDHKNFVLEVIKRHQKRTGELYSERTHGKILRCLVLLEGDINIIEDSIHYLVNYVSDIMESDIKDFMRWHYFLDQLCGFISLEEFDYHSFESEIKAKKEELLDRQNNDGSYFPHSAIVTGKHAKRIDGAHRHVDGLGYVYAFRVNRVAIEYLSKIIGPEHESIKKSIKYLQTQYENIEKEISRSDIHNQALTELLLSLVYAGKGPKKSVYYGNWERELNKQKTRHIKPEFLHTSPTYKEGDHIKEINQKVEQLIDTSKQSIKILSPYIDMYHENLIDKINGSQEIEFKVITRPKRDVSGERQRMGKQALEQLNRVSEGNLRVNKYLHSRMIIADEEHLLISSADLTRDQLYNEYNAGIYTRDDDAIITADEFFENIWEKSEHLND